ncbi:energy transducer TonB [Mesoterricola sediminis]|uniref:energy transducer TonB n=1 Tax=Mesoterricola sediminis TaxID=2927980 RepID=UPI00292EF49A|nr:energy transducer TonB [Mesoterricola sediminis]
MLSSELSADPLGKVHRGLTLNGSAFGKHVLIRTFPDEVAEAGFSAKVPEAQRVAGLLAGTRGLGTGHHVEAGRAPHAVCDYIPGRSLAQVIRKTREEQIPLGVDHALSVIQGMAQALLALDAKGLHHGLLTPHSVWVSYEGATQIIDTPGAAALAAVLPKARQLEQTLSPYRLPGASPLHQDLYALGAVLFELLTLEAPPARDAAAAAISRATLKAAQEDGPIPGEIAGLLRRLLAETQGFSSLGEFNKELERVLYDGDHSPTTFNMAFYMHTLFREESEQDVQAIKADQAADFTPFLPSDASAHNVLVAPDGTSRAKFFIWGGVALALLFGVMGYNYLRSTRMNEDLQRQLAELQQKNAANDNRLQDLAKQEEAQKALQDQLAKKASEAKTAEERARAKKDLEEAKAKAEELNRQKEEALRKRQEIAKETTAIAQAAAPAAQPPQPAPVQAPAPAPKVEPAPAPVAQAPAAQDVVETAAQIVNRTVPAAPRINKSFLPTALREQEIRVQLKVMVDAGGRPARVVIVKGVDGPFGYNDAAQHAALNSTYSPATRNGKPTTGWLTLEYNFGRPR